MPIFLGVLGLLLIVALVVYEMIQEHRLEAAEREWLHDEEIAEAEGHPSEARTRVAHGRDGRSGPDHEEEGEPIPAQPYVDRAMLAFSNAELRAPAGERR